MAHRPGSRGMPQQPHRLAGHERVHRRELDYLASQRLGRIATVGPDGQPHVVPASFRCNTGHDAIDVGGLRVNQTTKLRDAQRTARVSIVIDDVLPRWQPRMIKCAGPRWSSRRAARPSPSDSRTPSSASSPAASSHSASNPARRPARDRSVRRNRQQDRARRIAPHSHAAAFKDEDRALTTCAEIMTPRHDDSLGLAGMSAEDVVIERDLEKLRRDGSVGARFDIAEDAGAWQADIRRACRAAGLRIRTGLANADDRIAWVYHIDHVVTEAAERAACRAFEAADSDQPHPRHIPPSTSSSAKSSAGCSGLPAPAISSAHRPSL